jgi:hypothetical protein
MSAHMLTDEEYQKISNWLYTIATGNRSSGLSNTALIFVGALLFVELKPQEMEADSREKVKEHVTTMVRHLYNLNRLSLVTRYGDKFERDDMKMFRPGSVSITSHKEMIELLSSLRYQCNEYLTNETKLFQKLDHFIGEMCECLYLQRY